MLKLNIHSYHTFEFMHFDYMSLYYEYDYYFNVCIYT